MILHDFESYLCGRAQLVCALACSNKILHVNAGSVGILFSLIVSIGMIIHAFMMILNPIFIVNFRGLVLGILG